MSLHQAIGAEPADEEGAGQDPEAAHPRRLGERDERFAPTDGARDRRDRDVAAGRVAIGVQTEFTRAVAQ